MNALISANCLNNDDSHYAESYYASSKLSYDTVLQLIKTNYQRIVDIVSNNTQQTEVNSKENTCNQLLYMTMKLSPVQIYK